MHKAETSHMSDYFYFIFILEVVIGKNVQVMMNADVKILRILKNVLK